MMHETQKYAPVELETTAEREPIATPVAVGVETEPRFLEVASPATLPENYALEVEVEGQCVTVKVPSGGAEKGQKISVPFPDGWTAVPRVSTPVGHWKDGLCDCCRHGPIHPLLWNAWHCPLIALGQIMHRLKLTWCGNEGGSIAQTAGTFRTLLWVTISVYILRFLFSLSIGFNAVYTTVQWAVQATGDPDGYGQSAPKQDASGSALYSMRMMFDLSFMVFLYYLVAKTRGRIRSRYSIPETSCRGCEDCCCAVWCTCCTVAQMGRHTADYETYAAHCCSETGQPSHVPSVLETGHSPQHFRPSIARGGIV
mmetsp:Transcript_30318/g.64361  ORF Transcript_30318/g.64361 Transcript_30318/m.64361 type:complete len:312 (-) Transcript_30318:100-1035(-)